MYNVDRSPNARGTHTRQIDLATPMSRGKLGAALLHAYCLLGLGLILLLSGCGNVSIEDTSANMKAMTHIYKQTDGRDLTLRVSYPTGDRAAANRPVMVFFPVGGFAASNPSQFEAHAAYLNHRGMATVTVTCRVSRTHGSTPEQTVEDGRSAIRWIRAHAGELGIDPNRVTAAGGSAGAVVALCAGVIEMPRPADEPPVSARPDALVLFSPAVTYLPIDGREHRRAERLEIYRKRWGRSDLPEISAYQRVDAHAPPTMILHGEEDTVCPISTIRPFAAKMNRHGVRCDLVVYPGEGHGFYSTNRDDGEYFVKTMIEADRFLVSLSYLEGEGDVSRWFAERRP